jgi:DNA-binding transcriptional MerR regulator
MMNFPITFLPSNYLVKHGKVWTLLHSQAESMLIAELEKISGLPRDTIRFYERSQLISAPKRSANGYRNYDTHTVTELRFIRLAKEVGFTHAEIRQAMPFLKAPPARCQTLIAKLVERREQILVALGKERKRLRRVNELLVKFGAP